MCAPTVQFHVRVRWVGRLRMPAARHLVVAMRFLKQGSKPPPMRERNLLHMALLKVSRMMYIWHGAGWRAFGWLSCHLC